MGNLIFPTFQGFSWEKSKKPIWKNTIYEADSGKETVHEHWSYPRYIINLKYNFMTDNSISDFLEKGDIEKLQGFINCLRGDAESFLYMDDVENSVSDQFLEVGDGYTKDFQLVRSLPNWVEPVKGILDPPTIKINNVSSTAYTFTPDGVVSFDTAPPNGAVLSWSGSYYFRVRFNEIPELPRTFPGIYENISINLITVK